MTTGNEADKSHLSEVVEYDDLQMIDLKSESRLPFSRNFGKRESYEYLLHREWIIRRVSWSSTQARNTTLATIYPFAEVGQKPQVAAIRALHYMFHMTIEWTVEVVATFNMAGAVMVIPAHADWVPGIGSLTTIEHNSLLPHKVAFASDGNLIKDVMPFQSPYDYALTPYTPYTINGATIYDPLVHWGEQWQLVLKVMHQLTTNSSATQECEIIVRAKIVDSDFVLPHVEGDEEVEQFQMMEKLELQSIDPATAKKLEVAETGGGTVAKGGETKEAEKVGTKGIISDFMYAGARLCNWIKFLPVVGNVAGIVGMGAKFVGAVAENYGFQKPSHVSDVQLIAYDSTMDKRFVQSRGIADAFTFNLGAENDQSLDENIYSFGPQTNDFREYACIPGIVTNFEFSSVVPQGTLLADISAYPHLWNAGQQQIVPATVACRYATYYVGDLQHMFVVSASRFVETKIAIQIGTHLSGTPSLSSIGDTLTKVLTINGSGIIKFRTPYVSPYRVIDTGVTVTNPAIDIHCFLLSQSIQLIDGSTSGIATRVDWYAAFAPNVRFFGPHFDNELVDTTVVPAGFGYPYSGSGLTLAQKLEVQCDPREEFLQVFEGIADSKMVIYEDGIFPDEICHWNDIRMRGNGAMSWSNATYVNLTHVGISTVGPAWATIQPAWLKPYARWRTTMRYTVGPTEDKPTRIQFGVRTLADDLFTVAPFRATNFLSGVNTDDQSYVVEVPRWSRKNYDTRRRNMSTIGTAALPVDHSVIGWAAGDSTVGMVPLGLWRTSV